MKKKLFLLMVFLAGISAKAQNISGQVNSYFAVTSISGSTVHLASTAGLSSCDRVMILQMTGVTGGGTAGGTDNGAGNFEYAVIQSVDDATTVTLSAPITKLFSPATEVVQMIGLAVYDQDITLVGDVVPQPWNGTTGGVIVVDVGTHNINLNGHNFDATGMGYGGNRVLIQSNSNSCGSAAGSFPPESEWGYVAYAGKNVNQGPGLSGAPGRGGHGGCTAGIRTPGGGGGVGGEGAASTNNNYSSGGGGGGYGGGGSGASGGNAGTVANVTGTDAPAVGNLFDTPATLRLFLGASGGGEQEWGLVNGFGGGIIYLIANQITGSGSIIANGTASPIQHVTWGGSNWTASAGAGGGGWIILKASGTISPTIIVEAKGGYANFDNSTSWEAGGAGGGGFIMSSQALGTSDVSKGGRAPNNYSRLAADGLVVLGNPANTVACALPPDNDGDGIPDKIDLDDDNDGIPDTTEGFCIISSNDQIDGFDTPLQPNVNNNNYVGSNFNGWSTQNGSQINIIRVDGTGYVFGPDNAHDGNQYVDIANANDLLLKPFTVNSPALVSLSAWFSNRASNDPNYTAWIGRVELLDSNKNVIAQGNFLNFDNTVSDELWFESKITDFQIISPGLYYLRMYVDDYGHVDDINFCISSDSDVDNKPNYLDLDSDNDGIPDVVEAGGTDADHDGHIDYPTAGDPTSMVDADGDGLSDDVDDQDSGSGAGEVTSGTPLTNPDTDGDGINDVLDIDADNDGIVDNIEGQTTAGYVPPTGTDTDGDGLDDAYDQDDEATVGIGGGTGTAIIPTNTDGTDNPDYLDLDSDNDGDSDALEAWDTDNDGTADTVPANTDTDNDGLDDAYDQHDNNATPDSVLNPTNNGQTPTSFPDLDTAGGDRDWREVANTDPVAQNDSATTTVNTDVNVDVLANDNDPDGDTIVVSEINGIPVTPGDGNNISLPGGGTATLLANGTIQVTPPAGSTTPITFPYTISDGNGGTDSAQVNITFTNTAPVANDDNYTATEDTPLALAPLTNDNDPDGDTMTVTSINGTAITPGTPVSISVPNGTVNVDAAGNITFVPDANYNGGPITFPYTISDGNGGTDTANININVTAVNDAPVATDNNNSANEDTNVTGNVITDDDGDGVDSDVDGDTLSVTQFVVNGTTYAVPAGGSSTANLAEGDLTINSDGSYTFVPAANYNGAVPTATYTLSDGNGGTDTADLDITINSVNDAPEANDDNYTATEDTPLVLAPLTNDSDVDGDTLTVTDINGTPITPGTPVSIAVPNGTVTVDAAGNITFVPDANYNGGPITFPYTISDGNGGTDTANITINVTAVNDVPVATDNVYNGTEDNNVTGNILTDDTGVGVDSDVDGDTLSVTQFVVNGNTYAVPVGGNSTANIPGVGALTIGSDGAMTFVPVANYNGTVPTITYTVADGNGGTDTADVIINIASVNDMPVANDDSTTTMLDTPVTFNATDNDGDIDGDIDTATVDLDPSTPGIQNNFTDGTGNVWTVDNNGNVTFTPAPGFTGTATIPYTVNDNEGGTSNQANLSVFVQNPELTVTKDDGMDMTVPQVLTVGQVITYNITVTNTGNVGLTNINVTDANAVITAGNPIANLAPGNSANVTATHEVTQADIDNGSIINTATAETFFNGTPVSDDSDDTDPASGAGNNDPTLTNLLQNPELTVTKDDAIPANATVGDDIVYTIVVTNTGNVTLNNVVVTDANAQIGGSSTITTLAPGQSVTFTATHIITQADMNNGSISNTAVASTTFNGNPVSDDSDDANGLQPGDNDPTLSDLTPYQVGELTATLDDNDPSSPTNPSTYFAGDNINYTLNVENTGNISINNPQVPAGYTPVLSGGNNIGDTNGDGILDPGETWVYTGSHTLTQAEIDAGMYSSQEVVSGTDPNGATVTDTSDDPVTSADNDPTNTYFNLVSELEVKKTDALPAFVMVGNDITYTITATNTGNTTLSNIAVTDPNAQNITYVSGDTNNNGTMEPGESWVYTATHTITQADMDAGAVANQASVSSTNPQGDPVNDDASDDPDTPEPNDPTVSDLHSYQDPSMTTEKEVLSITDNGLAGDSAGDVIHYQISVQNSGNITINSLQIIDMMITNSGSTVAYSSGDTDNDGYLDVNETWVYTADYVVTQADIDSGMVVNSAVAYGIDSNGTPLNDVSDDPNFVPGPGDPDTDHNPTVTNFTQSPELTVTKQDAVLPAGTTVGDYITYTIVVTNTGNVTVDAISVTDTNATMNGVGSTPSLAPGDSVTFTAVHQITQDDMDNGFVNNQATANATDPNGNPVTDLSDDPDTAPLDDPTHTDLTGFQTTSMEATLDDNVQTNPSNPYNYNVGDDIVYTAELTNTGNVSITPVTPTGYTPIEVGGFNVGDTDQDGELDPGEVWQYTTTHTVTQADIDAGHYDNQVTFTGTAANGVTVSDVSDDPQDPTTSTDDVTVTYIAQFSQLTVEKTGVFNDANANGLADVGETITYTITVTNTGNQTITDVQVNDPNAVNITYQSGDTNGNGVLDPGEVWIYTAIHTLDQPDINAAQVENQATATGQDPANNPVSDISDDPNTGTHEDPTIVTVPVHAELTMEKTGEFTDANGNGYADVGEVITYTFTVHNAGNQTISHINIDDPFLTAAGVTYVSGDTNGDNLLQIDEDWVFTGEHVLTQADIDAGIVHNQALVQGEDPQGNTLTDLSDDPNDSTNDDQEFDGEPDDVTSTDVPQHPELQLFKYGHFNDENGNGLADIGETISYTFTVINIGNVTLTNIEVTDALPGIVVSGTPIILAPGQSDNTTFTAVYTLTKDDIDNGKVTNTALVTGDDPQGNATTDISDNGADVGPNADSEGDGEGDDPTVVETLGLDIMTVFTPNGDGKNDTWEVLGIQNFMNNTVKVYNRWGNLVYEKDHYTGNWDGTSNGRWTIDAQGKLPVGTYFYVIDLGNGHKPFTGYLYLNR